jgi:hypothetical protein
MKWALTLVCAVALLAADFPWKGKPPAQWTRADAIQVLTASPWARELTAGLSRRLSEDELREAGQMGQPAGIGYDGVDPKGTGPKLPTSLSAVITPGPNGGRSVRSMPRSMTVRLRWESALPVRVAELTSGEAQSPPDFGQTGYCIGVYGLPGPNMGGDSRKLAEPLKDGAVLRRLGKKDVKPTRVEAVQRSDGWAVFYLFPASAEISSNDKQVEFAAQIGRIVVVCPFDLAEMYFRGKLEI